MHKRPCGLRRSAPRSRAGPDSPAIVTRLGKREDGRFTFQFVTIEDVDVVDAKHIVVGDDNNGIVHLKVTDFLKAHAE